MNEIDNDKELGLDVGEYYEDITRIIKAKFPVSGSEADDLVQEVCKKIIKLNDGTSPYDPDKSSISHYIYMVASSVYSTGQRKKDRTPTKNAISFDSYLEGGDEDAEEDELLKFDGFIGDFNSYVEDKLDFKDTIPRRILMLTSMGYTKREIADILNVSFYRVDKDRKRLKSLAEEWRKSSLN